MNQIEDAVKRVLKVLVYVEAHSEEEITMEKLAKIACYSPFHFHRLFQAIVGETIHKYVKRLRLEKAASRLRYTDQPITDIALDAHFDTPSAFTKAFKQWIGKSPRNYRSFYKEVNKMTKQMNELLMIKPDKIEKLSAIDLLFIRKTGNYETSSQEAWDAMAAFIKEHGLDYSQLRYFSICHDDPWITSEEKLRFDACIQVPQGFQEKGEIGRQVIKGGKYAVFTHAGPHHQIKDTFKRIYLKWLPTSQEAVDDHRPVFCEHFNLEYVDKDESKLITKIYLPIS